MFINKIIDYLTPYTSKKHILISLILLVVIEALFVFFIMPSVQISSGGYGLIDGLLFASEQEYISLFNAYTSETRLLHYLSTSLDMILPFVYGFLIASVMIRCSNSTVLLKSGITITLLAVIFDYVENIGILFSISHNHQTGSFLIRYLQITTSAKSIFLGLGVVVLLWIVIKTLKKSG
ncbi:MAG: hypothetical protein PF590_07465 [Candidatus Delongbacteria bacterium]|jgi:hypothetical protein|nr:hypothetical protein [Candidatus Delongbacteria bacterium]